MSTKPDSKIGDTVMAHADGDDVMVHADETTLSGELASSG